MAARMPDAVPSSAQDILLGNISSVLDIPRINLRGNRSFISQGGHSLLAVRLSSLCRAKGVQCTVSDILGSNSLDEIARRSHTTSSVVGKKDGLTDIQADAISSCMLSWEDIVENLATTGIDGRLDWLEDSEPWPSSPTRCDDDGFVTDMHSSAIPSEEDGYDDTLGQLSSVEWPSSPVTSVVEHHSTPEGTERPLPMVPLNEMQLALIHGGIKNTGTNIIRYYESYRPQDIPRVKNAWHRVVELEPMLEVSYSIETSNLEESSSINPRPAGFRWIDETVCDQDTYQQRLRARPQGSTEVSSSFVHLALVDPSSGHAQRSTIIWTVHHALIDGYSAGLVLGKVRQALTGDEITAGPSFASVSHEVKRTQLSRKGEGDAYWASQRDLLADAADILRLPPPLKPLEGVSELRVPLGVPVGDLNRLASGLGVTPATVYHAAWAILLSLYNSQDNVVFGTVVSGRNLPLPGIESTIGPLVNTLPLCVSLPRHTAVADVIRDVGQRMIELAEFQWTTPANGFKRSFQTALAMQFDYTPDPSGGLPVQLLETPIWRYETDIPMSVAIHHGECLRLTYSGTAFSRGSVESLGNTYTRILGSLFRPELSVQTTLMALIDQESHLKLRKWGNCESPMTLAASIQDDLVTLFERAAGTNPSAFAAQKGATQLTYEELETQAARCAAVLSATIKPQEVICVDADRSLNWLVAIFGILKAGGVYCALDPSLSNEIRTSMFRLSGAHVFLLPSFDGEGRAPSAGQLNLFIPEMIQSETRLALKATHTPSASAYVCFTSGSTGVPKGVVCSHEGLVAFERDREVRLHAEPGIKISQLMSVAFDGSIHEIFSALCYGATLVLQAGSDPFEILGQVDACILTPSVAAVLDPHDFPRLRYVYLVGEPVKPAVSDRWSASKILYNMYGPTEATCGATIKRLLPGKPITIGPPNPSTRIYIFNERRELVPPGVIGEIYLAGVQISRGYIGLADITQQRFTKDPIVPGPGEYMYQTGDQGYWTETGDVMCLGRNDRQIKLRGFRLDLNDLEIRITHGVAGVKAVALARCDDFLVAALQPRSLTLETVKSEMARVLPRHAIPRRIVLVDEFPTTAAGKLDYKSLVAETFLDGADEEASLNTTTKAMIADIWRQVLRLGRNHGLHSFSDFFEVGGNSLLQITLLAKLSTTFKIRIPLKVVIAHTSIGDLAKAIDDFLALEKRPMVPEMLSPTDWLVSPMEKQWWYRYQLGQSTGALNLSFVASFDPGSINSALLGRALDRVLERHQLLRVRYVPRGIWDVQKVYVSGPPHVKRVRALDLWNAVNRPFQISHDYPIHAYLSADTIVIVLSHIIGDLTTVQMLLDETKILYEGGTLPAVEQTYAQWIARDNHKVPAPCDLQFWTSTLAGNAGDSTALETVNAEDGSRQHRGTSQWFELCSGSTYARLLELSSRLHISLQQIAMAAVALALSVADSPSIDLVLGTPFMNRVTDADLHTIGLFLEPLPVHITYSTSSRDEDPTAYLRAVRAASQAAVSHAIPWHQLLTHLGFSGSDPTGNAIFEAMVTFHDSDHALALDLPSVQPCVSWSEGTKFPLMTEFVGLKSGKLLLRVEYEMGPFDRDHVARLAASVSDALVGFVDDRSLSEIQAALERLESPRVVERNDLFGKAVEAI